MLGPNDSFSCRCCLLLWQVVLAGEVAIGVIEADVARFVCLRTSRVDLFLRCHVLLALIKSLNPCCIKLIVFLEHGMFLLTIGRFHIDH